MCQDCGLNHWKSGHKRCHPQAAFNDMLAQQSACSLGVKWVSMVYLSESLAFCVVFLPRNLDTAFASGLVVWGTRGRPSLNLTCVASQSLPGPQFKVISERLPIGFDHSVSDVGFERNVDWLVVWNYFLLFHILGMSSSQLNILNIMRWYTHDPKMVFGSTLPNICHPIWNSTTST